MRRSFRLVPVIACWALVACSSAVEEPETPAQAKPKAEVVPPGALARHDVVKVVDGGLGAFLQKVAVEPSLNEGRFQGFRIVSLQPENFWHDVDLQPGDVVVGVNGKSIEDPNDAFLVFEGLRSAPEIRVHLLREGVARELHFAIFGAPEPAKAPTDPAPSKATPASSAAG